MRAKDVMKTEVITARIDEPLCQLLPHMRKVHLRMLPVVDHDGVVRGVISTFSILEHLLPSYVTSGDLSDLSFAPDIDLMRAHFADQQQSNITELMEEALLVTPDDAALAVAAALIRHGKHECAMVVDEQQRLLGVISAGDILNGLAKACGND